MKPKAIICDIDGTLANNDHRRHFIDPRMNLHDYEERLYQWDDPSCGYEWRNKKTNKPFKKDWKSFNQDIMNDTPNDWCVQLLRSCACKFGAFADSSGGPIIIFISGREEIYRQITENQIWAWFPLNPCRWLLFMRKSQDYRDDTIIKHEIYEKHIKDNYNVLFVMDDRSRVVKMWRELGLVCLQCADGDF